MNNREVSDLRCHRSHYDVTIMSFCHHYNDVIMSAMAFQINSLAIVYSIVYSGADQGKIQSSASLTSVWGIHR